MALGLCSRHNLCLLFRITITKRGGGLMLPLPPARCLVSHLSGAKRQAAAVLDTSAHLHFRHLANLINLEWLIEGAQMHASKHHLHERCFYMTKDKRCSSVHQAQTSVQLLCLNILFRKTSGRCCNISKGNPMCRCSHISQLQTPPSGPLVLRALIKATPNSVEKNGTFTRLVLRPCKLTLNNAHINNDYV